MSKFVVVSEGGEAPVLVPNKKYPCSGCGCKFLGKDLHPYRYEASQVFCMDCEVEKEEEDEREAEEMNEEMEEEDD